MASCSWWRSWNETSCHWQPRWRQALSSMCDITPICFTWNQKQGLGFGEQVQEAASSDKTDKANVVWNKSTFRGFILEIEVRFGVRFVLRPLLDPTRLESWVLTHTLTPRTWRVAEVWWSCWSWWLVWLAVSTPKNIIKVKLFLWAGCKEGSDAFNVFLCTTLAYWQFV